ncbi:alpha/beta hydrolase [Ampullimonas aquatilis]|uniref:alpha/beta hydrolase n=1 Tax=Ampullimonas aquatilis TaxID=1341549 RepID=UPI003C709BE6
MSNTISTVDANSSRVRLRTPWLIGFAVVLSILVLLSACAPLTLINGFDSGRGYIVQNNFAYGADPRQRLDVYLPASNESNDHGSLLHPLVVFFYGGSWNRGDRADYRFVGRALARRGMVVVVADYRLYPQVRYPDFLQDSAQAVAWALQHASQWQADPTHLFLMGHSAGAYNAAMLALDDHWLTEQGVAKGTVKGWIGLAGPYDFLPIENPDAKPVFNHPNYPSGSQPIDFVCANSPPAYLAAATKDTLVNPQRNTLQMADKLTKAGVPVKVELFDKVSHASLIATLYGPLSWLAPVAEQIVAFVTGKDRQALAAD